jgi:16S rRNA processing protein RimM
LAASGSANEIAAAPGVAAHDWVELGRVLRPHGLAGDLLASLHSEDPTNLIAADTVALRGRPGTIPFAVRSIEPAPGRGRVRLRLAGIESRERAQLWADAAVLVPPSALPELPEGEFYWRELIGLEARALEGGAPLGRVAELVATRGADVLVLRSAASDRLVPVVEGLIARLDRAARVVWLDAARLPEEPR